jgi:hypothetical protein
MALGKAKEAEERFAQALVLFRQLADQQGEAQVLSSMSSARRGATAVVTS